MSKKLIAEIERQLVLESGVTCIGPPYVVLNGHELKQKLDSLTEKLAVAVEALEKTIEDYDCASTSGGINVSTIDGARKALAKIQELEHKPEESDR